MNMTSSVLYTLHLSLYQYLALRTQEQGREIIQIWSSQWGSTAYLTSMECRRDRPHVQLSPLILFKLNIWHKSIAESQYFCRTVIGFCISSDAHGIFIRWIWHGKGDSISLNVLRIWTISSGGEEKKKMKCQQRKLCCCCSTETLVKQLVKLLPGRQPRPVTWQHHTKTERRKEIKTLRIISFICGRIKTVIWV